MLENYKYPVVVTKSDRKTLSLEIKDGKVFVKCNKRLKEKQILDFLIKKEKWIEKRLGEYEPNTFYLLGKKYNVIEKKGADDYFFSGDNLYIYGNVEYLKDKIFVDNQNIMFEIIQNCLDNFEVQPNKVKIKRLKRTLGICHKNKDISLSLFLLKYPSEVIEMVVYHELVHLIHFNHSKSFYECLAKYSPEHKKLKGLTLKY